MADPSLYTYPSPLEGYQNLPALPTEKAADGKSLANPPSTSLSEAYTSFPPPISNGERGGFDIHVYFLQTDDYEVTFARELHERIRRECKAPSTHACPFPPSSNLTDSSLPFSAVPELRIYPLFERPIGPHPQGMFEVNVFTPHQFGAFVSWLVINRGPLSALVHPNTGDDVRDHTQRATWMGREVPLSLRGLRRAVEGREG